MQKITPFIWLNDQAEQAAQFYTSIFKNSRINTIRRYGKHGPLPEGTVMTVAFELNGQEFVALNGGPHYSISPAISFVINCEDQAEIDFFWEKLSDGGQVQQCGWLTDKFGVTWQVVPAHLPDLLDGNDPDQANRVMGALFQMVKLDLATLTRAARG